MIKRLLKCVREYKAAAVVTPLFAAGEVFLEVIIPTLMASLIDDGISRGSMPDILRIGA